ncbi:MAG: AMP-binding protein, partial [Pseudomonadota bacterium]
MTADTEDLIDITQHPTLDAAFRERARRSTDKTAYIQYDADQERWLAHSWADTAREVARWQTALQGAGLRAGDRVGIMMHNRWEWVIFDQAALGLGLVTVPLYPNDRHDNIAHVLEDSGTRLLFLQNQDQWEELRPIDELLGSLVAVVTLNPLDTGSTRARVVASADWLPDQPRELQSLCTDPQALFTIIYTSGTTGKPKGVMLSHHNVLTNAAAALSVVNMFADDRLLSFLPLSHALERTAGYYLNILSGSAVAYARSIPQLGEDLLEIKPTVLVSVPRIFERVNTKVQAKLAQD